MDNFMVAIIVLLISSLIGRRINQKATEKIDDNQKANLVTLFSKSSLYNFAILILILGLYFANTKFEWIDQNSASVTFAVFILSFLAGTAYSTNKKLKENDFPENYIKKNLLASTVRFLGLIFFFLILNYMI